MKQYRIKELNGEFTIQVLSVKTTYLFFFSWVETNWCTADIHGNKTVHTMGNAIKVTQSCPAFETLEEAQEQIRRFQAQPIYHYPEQTLHA